MTTTAFNQARHKLKATEIIKLSLDGKKRFTAVSKIPPAPTTAMRKLKNLPNFAVRAL